LAKMKVAVIGSRRFEDAIRFQEVMDSLKPRPTLIISGGAAGVDSWAYYYSRVHGIPELTIRPKDMTDRKSYLERNKIIVDTADRIVAFWDGISRGTLHVINLADMQGKNVMIIREGN